MELFLRTEMERNAKYINFNIPVISHSYPLSAVVFYWSTIVFYESTCPVVIVLGGFLKNIFQYRVLGRKMDALYPCSCNWDAPFCTALPIFRTLWNFYAPEIEDRGAYCFCPVCHSVLLSETLTLLITFEQWVFMSISRDKTFLWVPLFLTLWPWPWSLTHFFENFKLANNFWTVSARALIFHMSIPCDKTFPWFHWFIV